MVKELFDEDMSQGVIYLIKNVYRKSSGLKV